jgi:vacuolar-type H+-ATPase subunit E/Vma4
VQRAGRLELRESRERATLEAEVELRRRGSRRELLVARHDAVEAVLERVRAALPGLVKDPRYLRSVGPEFDEALEMVAGADATLLAAAPVADALGSRRPPGISIQVEPDLAGFRLTTTDGRVEILATLEERLRRLVPRLRIELGRELEEAAG